MLSVIEILQFKSHILEGANKTSSLDVNDDITEYLIDLPEQCPKSHIVYNENRPEGDYKSMAYDIYTKYIKEQAQYEINVLWQTRYELTHLMDVEQRWNANEEYDEPMKL